MGRLIHEDGYPTVEPGNQIIRSRSEVPTDVEYRTIEDLKARLQELKEKKDSLDKKKHFTGLSRLGSRYTVAEPFAFFDGPTEDQRKLEYGLVYGGGALAMFTAMVLGNKTKHAKYLTGVLRGLAVAPFGAIFCGEIYKWNIRRQTKVNNVLLHYALLHEKDFPVIGKLFLIFVVLSKTNKLIFKERKKFGEIIRDWVPQRSLHHLGEGNFSWKIW